MDIQKQGKGMPELKLDHDPTESAHLFNYRKKLSREDLMEILTMDGTLEQIEEAVAKKELTETERDRIYDFLRAKTQEQSDSLFAQILQDVKSAPVYETAKEEAQAWKEMKVDLAHQIKDMQNSRFEIMNTLDAFNEETKKIENTMGPEIANGFRDSALKQILIEEDRLDIKTKQHSALALMHTEAKSMEAQARARIFYEATQPYRSTLKQSWDSLADRAHTAYHHATTLRETVQRTKKLDRNFLDDVANKIHLFSAKRQLKDLNAVQKKIDKAERKMLAEANKISKKEFRRKTFIKNLDSWSRGEQPPKQELQIIKDIDEAQRVLKRSKEFADQRLEYMQRNLNGLRERRDDVHADVTRSLEHVADIMRSRSERVMSAAEIAYEHNRNGDFGNISERTMDKIEANIERGIDATFLDRDGLTKDLQKFMEENGFGHLMKPERTNGNDEIEIGNFKPLDFEVPEFGRNDVKMDGDHDRDR